MQVVTRAAVRAQRRRDLPSLEQQHDGVQVVARPAVRAQRYDEVVEAVAGELGGQDDGAVLPLVLLRQLRLLVRALLSTRDVTARIHVRCQVNARTYINTLLPSELPGENDVHVQVTVDH